MRTNAFLKDDDARNGTADWSSDHFQDGRPARAVSHELETIFGSGDTRLPPSRASGAHVQTVALGAPVASEPARRKLRKLPVAAIGGGLLVVAVGSVLGLTMGSPELNTPASTGTRTAAAPRAAPAPAPAAPTPLSSDEYASAEELTPLTPLPAEAGELGEYVISEREVTASTAPAGSDVAPMQASTPVATRTGPVAAESVPVRAQPVGSVAAQPSPAPAGQQPASTRVVAAPAPRRAPSTPPRVVAPAPTAVAERAEPGPSLDSRQGAIERPLMGARLLGGRIRNSDYPRAARQAGAEGTVFVRFAVRPDGRVGSCNVTRSSGHAALDATTCRLIQKRFRYAPARDAQGRTVPDVMVGRQVWWMERDGRGEGGRDGAETSDATRADRGPRRG